MNVTSKAVTSRATSSWLLLVSRALVLRHSKRWPRIADPISVILPTRNRASSLANAIASVVGQTHSDWELVVIDDASEDNTDAVVDSFDDTRIRRIRLDGRVGAAKARNLGIQA